MIAIGIDLGTTNSCAAVYRKGRVDMIRDAEGQSVTPSVAAAQPNGDILVGWPARRLAESNPEHTYRAIKRLIGRQFDDPEVATTADLAAFGIGAADNGEAWVQGRERLHPPAEISGWVLKRLREAAERALGQGIVKAVITVPAYFNDAQRKATRDAGEIAGLEVLRIINEPTAAALAHGLDNGDGAARTIAVYDLGGGTFDLSILRAEGSAFEVLATNGDTFLGGEDFDARLANHLAEGFKAEHGIDLRADPMARQRLREEAERVKRELSETQEAAAQIRFAADDPTTGGPLHLETSVTRATLEALTADLIDRSIGLCALALTDCELTAADIDQVLLVGGMTRMPAVRAAVAAFFGAAAPIAAPDPDQIVAQGAAIMAASLTGGLDIELADVTPFALGVETADREMAVLIGAQTKIPTQIKRVFTTAADDQDAVTVRLRQGNEPAAGDNLALGQFHLAGLKAGPRGGARIDVTLDIDADGIASFSARDRATGRSQGLTIDTMGLTPGALKKMAKEAKAVGGASPEA